MREARSHEATHYQLNHFKDIANIRRVTKDQFRELGSVLEDRQGGVPIFGYPLFNFSPRCAGHRCDPREARHGDEAGQAGTGPNGWTLARRAPQLRSPWLPLSRAIVSGAKKDRRLLIKDLLEGLDEAEQKLDVVFRKFTPGKGAQLGDGSPIANRREAKERPAIPATAGQDELGPSWSTFRPATVIELYGPMLTPGQQRKMRIEARRRARLRRSFPAVKLDLTRPRAPSDEETSPRAALRKGSKRRPALRGRHR